MSKNIKHNSANTALLQTLNHMGRGVLIVDEEGKPECWNSLFLQFFELLDADLESLEHWSQFGLISNQFLGIDEIPHHVHYSGTLEIYGQSFELELIPMENGALSLCYTPTHAREQDLIQLQAQIKRLKKENLAIQEALDDMAKESLTDRLTGAWNRRYFDQNVQVELLRAQRFGWGLSLILFDIDHFKQINDLHGHAIGDQVLIHLSTLIRAALRETDLLIRWGGEEFMILAPGIGKYSCAHLAEKLRQQVSLYDFPGISKVTISLGISEYLFGENVDRCVQRADQALYEAKHQGRNRWIIDQKVLQVKEGRVQGLQWQELLSPDVLCQTQVLCEHLNQIIRTQDDPEQVQELLKRSYAELQKLFEKHDAQILASGHPKAKWHTDIHQHLLLGAELLIQKQQHGSGDLLALIDYFVSQILMGHMGQMDQGPECPRAG